MTRDDAIARLRRQLPVLRRTGITGVSLVNGAAREAADGFATVEVLLDIDLDAHRDFDMLALIGVEDDLAAELGIPVHAFVAQGMRDEARMALVRDAVPIA